MTSQAQIPSGPSAAGASGPASSSLPEPKVYSDRWEQIWGAGLGRGEQWDATKASPSLVEMLRSGQADVKGSRVLVPGCGRGYDLPVFLGAGAVEVVGLELAPTAIREAMEYLREVTAQQQQGQGQGEGGSTPPPTAMRVEEGNFFQWTDAGGAFDVGFDYTFGCAMQPDDRQQWASSWGRLVRSGGVLVTLVFPVNPAADPRVGPPFPVSPELYRQLLEPQGFEVTYKQPVPGELSHPPRVGKEVMMVWRKK